MRATFRVVGSFELKTRHLFVVFGEVIEGELAAGVQISMPLQDELYLTGKIASVEFVDFAEGLLTLDYDDPDELEVWRSAIEEGALISAFRKGPPNPRPSRPEVLRDEGSHAQLCGKHDAWVGGQQTQLSLKEVSDAIVPRHTMLSVHLRTPPRYDAWADPRQN